MFDCSKGIWEGEMSKKLKIFIVVLLAPSVIFCAEWDRPGWTLTFHDEFNYTGLPDESVWGYEEGYVRNNEAQYYARGRSENSRVEDGMLVLEARRDWWENHEITSASVTSRNKVDWLYGRVEVKAKLPTGRGMWPAIWMLGYREYYGGWPSCGELDILENVGFDPDRVHANIHTRAYNHTIGTNKGNSIIVDPPYEDFHIYSLEWFEDHIDFYFDDTNYFSFENEYTGWETWPYDREEYLILNIAVGGSWGGAQGIDNEIFPQTMEIEYVRVYTEGNVEIEGCPDSTASNYYDLANTDDGSCEYPPACKEPGYAEYDPDAKGEHDPDLCVTSVRSGRKSVHHPIINVRNRDITVSDVDNYTVKVFTAEGGELVFRENGEGDVHTLLHVPAGVYLVMVEAEAASFSRRIMVF
jgi:beta-glucanase (GH16 family)